MPNDYKSGLPIKSEADGVDEKVIVKIVDGTMGGSNQMSVDADKNAHVEMHGNDPAGVDRVLILSEEGRLVPRGDYDAATNTKPGSNALILHSRQAAPNETHQTFRPTGVASSDGSNAKAQDVAIRDESGNAFTTSNPFPVTLVDSEGTEVNDYQTEADVPASGTSNHDYTVTALKTLKLSKVEASCAARAKFMLQVETGVATGVYTTKFTKLNSTAEPNVTFDVKELITVAAGVKVRVVRISRDNQASDMYSTISGHEI